MESVWANCVKGDVAVAAVSVTLIVNDFDLSSSEETRKTNNYTRHKISMSSYKHSTILTSVFRIVQQHVYGILTLRGSLFESTARGF